MSIYSPLLHAFPGDIDSQAQEKGDFDDGFMFGFCGSPWDGRYNPSLSLDSHDVSHPNECNAAQFYTSNGALNIEAFGGHYSSQAERLYDHCASQSLAEIQPSYSTSSEPSTVAMAYNQSLSGTLGKRMQTPTTPLSEEYRASIARYSNDFHASTALTFNSLSGTSSTYPLQEAYKPRLAFRSRVYEGGNYHNEYDQAGFHSDHDEYISKRHSPDSIRHELPTSRLPSSERGREAYQSTSESTAHSSYAFSTPHSYVFPESPPPAIRKLSAPQTDTRKDTRRSARSLSPHHKAPREKSHRQKPRVSPPWPGTSQSVLKLNPTKKSPEKKQALACLFCRERKIACGRPDDTNPDQRCNQCARRHLECQYPLESRRGQHKRRRKEQDAAEARSPLELAPRLV